MEGIHQHAYSMLLDTVGMPEVEYQRFQEFEEMKAKHDFFAGATTDSLEDIAKTLAIYSAFGEGLQLFSSFAILLNFSRFNKMKGMCQIITWSVRDESLHVDSMIKLFHAFIDENPKLWKSSLKKDIYEACKTMVELEDKFIDLCFSGGELEGLTSDEVKTYIRFIADRRCLQLGLKPIYKQKKNPLPWLDWVLNAVEHSNFFETRSTEYSKGSLTGSWDEVWNNS
jgi:ribonucleoside-diphosphate reductase beta chain